MFRLNAVPEFRVTIPSGEMKTCIVKYPTDKQWCDRMRKLKLLRTPLGRDKFLSEIPERTAADAALFDQIRVDKDGPPFDEWEGAAVIDQIDGCRVVGVSREGRQFRIEMEDAGELVAHVLRIPLQHQKMEYERADSRLISGRRQQEITAYLEPAGVLWDAIMISMEGYAAGVPIPHKYSAIRELLTSLADVSGGLGIDCPEAPSPADSAS